jgi:hypothetical protein
MFDKFIVEDVYCGRCLQILLWKMFTNIDLVLACFCMKVDIDKFYRDEVCFDQSDEFCELLNTMEKFFSQFCTTKKAS